MENLIHCAWIRRSVTFCTGLALISALLASSKPATSAFNSSRRWIEVNLSEQKLSAWEGKKLVYTMRVSTGKRLTPTPKGSFSIQAKLRSTRMQGKDYDIADVPYTMYFSGDYAIHGAYWRHRFGTPASHGCVNLSVKQARKLYNWASVGTQVVVDE